MSSKYLMGLDAGGSGGRCLLVDVSTGDTFVARRRWTARALPDGWSFDLDAERCFALLGDAARESLERASAMPDQIVGVATTGMRLSTVVVDRDGRIVHAAPNRDARGASVASKLAGELGSKLHARTGQWPNPVSPAVRYRQYAENAADLWGRAATVFSLGEWLGFRMCGERAAEASQEGCSLLLDVKTRDWAWDLVDELRVPRELLPPIKSAGSRLGTLSAQAATALGLRAGTPVAVGGADTQCALLGAGVIEPGQLAIVAGSSTPLMLVLDNPIVDAEARLWTQPHLLAGQWVLEANASNMGDAVEWFAQLLFPDAPNPVAQLAAEAAGSVPGASGMLSTLGVTIMNASQMSLPVGDLTMSHFSAARDPSRRRHLARAVFEGLAYGIRTNAAQLISVSGIAKPPLWMTGGMSRSTLFTQLVADVMDRKVNVPKTADASALGAAICAGVGAGVFPSLESGAQALARTAREPAPDAARARIYRDRYNSWESARKARAQADEIAASICLQTIATEGTEAEVESQFRPRILVTADVDEESLAALRGLGEVTYAPYRKELRLLTDETLVEALDGYQVFVTEVDIVDAAALKRAKSLRVIATCRGEAVNIDLDACTALGIPVLNAPGRNADAVAEMTVAFMLVQSRKLLDAAAFLRQPHDAGDMAKMGQGHESLLGREIWHKTIGLVGLGLVGRSVARRLLPFGARIVAFDPYVKEEDALAAGAELMSLDRVLAESDFVSLHAAVSEGTRGLIGAKELSRMKRGAFLINTARAALVDEDALVAALRTGQIAGAAIDVFSVEPPGHEHPLVKLPNVLATPHVAGNTVEIGVHQGRVIVDDLKHLLRGERARNLLNPKVIDGFAWEGPRQESAAALAKLADRPGPAVTDLDMHAAARPKAAAPASTRAPSPAPQTPHAGKKRGLLGRIFSGKNLQRFGMRTTLEPAPSAPATADGEARARMDQVLHVFVAMALEDAAMLAFAADQRVSTSYTLPDIGLEFHLFFDGGKITGAAAPSPSPADVRLKMKAEVFDAIMMGKMNGMRAAMTGKLSFTGDTRRAMTLQRIQNDMLRLYQAACVKTGGPGDLSNLGEAPAAFSSASTRPAGAAASAPGDLRSALVDVVNELYATGLVTATGGNISAREPGKNEAWITPSQMFKGRIGPEALVRVDLDGQPLDLDGGVPSSERLMHCAVYRARPDVEAVIHAHAPYATMLGLSGLPFHPISTEAAFLRDLPRVPFIMPGSNDLARVVADMLGKNPAVILLNHGILVAGSTLRRAADLAEIIERTSQVILGCYAVGKAPPVLAPEVVAELQELGDLMA